MRSLSNYMCLHYFFKFILDFWNKLKCTKGVKSENVSVHAKLYSFGKFDTKLLSRKLHKLIYNYFRFTWRYHAISISLSSGKRLKKCMHAYVINVFICFREKLVHRINANSVQYNFLKYIRINKSIIKVILVVPPLCNLCSPLLRSCSLASISFLKFVKLTRIRETWVIKWVFRFTTIF